MVRNSWKAKCKENAMILLGNFIIALGIQIFIIPVGIITGGTTGIALIMEYFLKVYKYNIL